MFTPRLTYTHIDPIYRKGLEYITVAVEDKKRGAEEGGGGGKRAKAPAAAATILGPGPAFQAAAVDTTPAAGVVLENTLWELRHRIRSLEVEHEALKAEGNQLMALIHRSLRTEQEERREKGQEHSSVSKNTTTGGQGSSDAPTSNSLPRHMDWATFKRRHMNAILALMKKEKVAKMQHQKLGEELKEVQSKIDQRLEQLERQEQQKRQQSL